MKYDEGQFVEWEWGQGKAFGEIIEVFTSDVSRQIKGNEVKREASDSNPAYLIDQVDGDAQVLKSHSEVTTVNKDTVYDYAEEKNISGRSKMTKEELLSAI